MKITREGVGHEVGAPRDIVKAGDVAMKTLVDAEQTEQEGRNGIGGSAPLSLPESGVEVIASTEYRALAHVQSLGGALEVKQATSQLQV